MAARDELVMVVATAELFPQGAFQGLRTGAGAYLGRIFAPGRARYLARALAEEDPSWKQIIPYVIVHCGDDIFCYRRGKQSTESRLVALHSVGLGGHIRQADESLFTPPGWQAYRAAMERELEEEVGFEAPVRQEKLVAAINDDATPVGSVHFGLVHLLELEAPRALSRETKIAEAHFVPLAELMAEGGPKMETWSEFCLQHWREIRAEPGYRPE